MGNQCAFITMRRIMEPRHAPKLRKLRCNLDSFYKYYFTNRAVNLWNNLPENVVAATSVSMFKTASLLLR